MKHILGSTSRSSLTAVEDVDIQPNAIDLKIGRVFRIKDNVFEISNDHKRHRGSFEIFADDTGYFHLGVGQYEVVMENMICMGDNEAGWVITRSTFNRNGCFLTSGLYDSGYGVNVETGEKVGGVMAAVLHVTCAPARIKKGTRIGQFLLFDAEMLHQYDGAYGNHKEHDKKYTS